MKTIKKSSILLSMMAIMILTACKKDPVSGIVEVVVQNPEITPSSDIRVNKISGVGDINSTNFNYNNQGKILNVKYNNSTTLINITHSTNKIKLVNADPEIYFNYWPYWINSTINLNQKAIKSVVVSSNYPYVYSPGLDGMTITKNNTVNFIRTTNSIDSVFTVFNSFNFYNAGDYKFIQTNSSGLPVKILKTSPLTKVLEITYQPGPSIPNKLKRMVNEYILEISRFGAHSPVSQVNFGLINGNQFPPANLGYEGKMDEASCIFGLHRVYTLQETSTEMVSSIKETTYYGNGAPVVKTTNYPYTHNSATRNLVVGGLSIFYDVVEIK